MGRKATLMYAFGDFLLNVEERILLCNGELIPLTPKMLETLLVLVQNRGHIMAKDEIMKKVWPDVIVEEANLAVNISRLRRVLDKFESKDSYIETIPRRGYCFVAEVTEVKSEIGPHGPIDSIAILPFYNADDDPEAEYFSDGMTESLINRLSLLPQLRVMAHSTILRFKAQSLDPQEVGQTLGVRAVVTGRVSHRGGAIFVDAELVDVMDGSLLWGDRYSTESTEIYSVQEDIASEISENLRLKLSSDQKKRITKRFTQDTEAYELYLKGRYYWNKRTNADLKRGLEYFRQAIAKDPNYSLAYVGVADCLTLLGLFGAEPPRVIMPEAKALAMEAIHLDQTLGEAYASLAQIRLLYDWDWRGAERDYHRALRLSPKYPTALQWHGEYLGLIGRPQDGIEELRKARELDPLSLIINTNLGLAYYWARQYDRAIEQLERTLELEPNFFRAHLHVGMAYEGKSMYENAVIELEKARRLNENPWTLAGLAHAYASWGKRDEAMTLLERLLKLAESQYVSSAIIAVAYAGFKEDGNETFDWLAKAYQERAGLLVWLKVWPIFDHVRSNKRFIELVDRIG